MITYAKVPLQFFFGSECCCGVMRVELLSSEAERVSNWERQSASLEERNYFVFIS